MFGEDKDTPKNRLGIIAQVGKMLSGANDLQLMQFAKKPIIDWVDWLRSRPHSEKPGQMAIDIIAHSKDEQGKPRTEIIAGRLNPDGTIEMISRAELSGQLTRFIADGAQR